MSIAWTVIQSDKRILRYPFSRSDPGQLLSTGGALERATGSAGVRTLKAVSAAIEAEPAPSVLKQAWNPPHGLRAVYAGASGVTAPIFYLLRLSGYPSDRQMNLRARALGFATPLAEE